MDKPLRIWILEDDESTWDHEKEMVLERFPKAQLKFFENAGFAARSTGSPDFIVMDLGGASSLGCDMLSLAAHNLEALAEKFPGAIFILFSALGGLAEEAIQELKARELYEAAMVLTVEGYDFGGICNHIKEWK